MMKNFALFLLMLCALPSSAASIRFEQGGWSQGGPLRVAFTGTDLDSDGAISLPELTEFHASWMTPAAEQAVWQLPDIEPDGFSFAGVGDYVLFARNADYSLVSAAFEGETLSSVFDQFLFPVDSSTSPAAETPEPSTLVLSALALIAARCVRKSSGGVLRVEWRLPRRGRS